MNADVDTDEFLDLLHAIAEQYDRTVSAAAGTMFFGALQQYDIATVRGAFNRFIRSPQAKYGFPKPIHIIEIIEGSEEEKEANAWAILTDACRRIGSYTSAVFEDVALAAVVERMFKSWAGCVEYWGDSGEMQWQAKRKEFILLYRIAAKEPRRNREPVLLLGRSALENQQSGYFPRRQSIGIILVDGHIEFRYLQLDVRTGLPTTGLRDVLALPPPHAALPPPPADRPDAEIEIPPDFPPEGPERGRWILRKAFEVFLSRQEQLRSERVSETRDRFGMTASEEDARRERIRQQAERDGTPQDNSRASRAVPGSEAAPTGDADRDSDQGSRSTGAGSRNRLRAQHREGMEVRSRVASAENRPGDRGRKLRPNDSGRKRR
jgi:hypothetical protein